MDQDDCSEEEIFFEVGLPEDTPNQVVVDLAADLKASGLVNDYGASWVQESGVRGYSRSGLATSMLCRCLSDLPEETRFSLKTADGASRKYLFSAEADDGYDGAVKLLGDQEDCDDYEEDEEWSEEDLAELNEAFVSGAITPKR